MSTTKNIRRTVGRTEAARIVGLKPDTLKQMAMQKRGPALHSKLGTSKQARVLYDVREIERWRSDPASYEQRTYGGEKHRGRGCG